MTIHPLFTVHTLRPFYAFSNVLDFINQFISSHTTDIHNLQNQSNENIHIMCNGEYPRSLVLRSYGLHMGYRSGVIRVRNVQYFICSKNGVFNFTTVRYSLHKCSETILCLKHFTVHVSPVSCAVEFMEARKTCNRVVWTSVWSIPYLRELRSQNCIVKTSEPLIA